MKVSPNLVGEISKDLKLINQNLEPKWIKVKGPEKLMKGLKQISTSPIDLSLLKKTGNLKVLPSDMDQRMKVITEEPLHFHFEISPRKANITLKNVKIRFLTSARRYSAKHRFVSMDVLVSEGASSSLHASEVEVIADIPDGATGVTEIPLRATLPEGVFLMKIHPTSIKVSVKP